MVWHPSRIRKTARKLRKLFKKAPKRPTPEQTHRLRTEIRHLEATFDALRLNFTGKERRLIRDLGRFRSRAGKIRDMDVLTAAVTSVYDPQEKDCAVQLLEYLGAERYKHARKLHARMNKHGSYIAQRVKRLSARLDASIPDVRASSSNSSQTSSAIATAVRLSIELNSPRTLNRINLHPYRLKVKELRDVLRLTENPANQEFIEMLGKVKDAIGEWHDWQELVAIATDVLDHGARCKLLTTLKHTTGEKYDHALALANKMRKQFLRSRSHKLPGPALVASTAVAS